MYSSTCHERPPPVRSESGPSWQVAAGYRDINTTTLQKWPAKAGGRSPKGPAVAGTTVPLNVLENVISRLLFISPKFDMAILTADDFIIFCTCELFLINLLYHFRNFPAGKNATNNLKCYQKVLLKTSQRDVNRHAPCSVAFIFVIKILM